VAFTRQRATHAGLPLGDYVVRGNAAKAGVALSEDAASLSSTIVSAWWLYILLGSFAGAGLYLVRRSELKRVQLRNRLEIERIERERLKELDEAKSRFYANISHELRTPLTLVQGQIESVLSQMRGAAAPESVERKLRMAARNARQLQQLINELLDLSKLEAGRMELNAVRADVVPLLKGVVASFHSAAEEEELDLSFCCSAGSVVLRFDPDKIERVMTNLLSNALKFTPAGGSVTVRAAVRDEPAETANAKAADADRSFEITVADTGIGITADRLPYVFDRFYQAGPPLSREHISTGIGLALARELVELHGGTISVTSQAGVGSEFVVLLPLAGADEIVVPSADQPTAAPFLSRIQEPVAELTSPDSPPGESDGPDVGRDLVLIVEDNADLRSYLREQLEGEYKIVEAVNGEEGIEVAMCAIPDLIVADVMMPGIDGYEMSRVLRGDERTSHVPIILLTARASMESRLEGLDAGVDDYVTKPFHPPELRARVRNLIAQRRRLREQVLQATVLRPSEVTATPVDQRFLERLLAFVEERIRDPSFTVEELAAEVSMSVSQLNRKLRALVGQPAARLVRSIRLQRAADLLQHGSWNISQIAVQVGFRDSSHFARSFKKQFGRSPTDYKLQS
jgi:signal transduction histidine kinase